MPDIKLKTFEGKFDFPFDVPFVLHELPDNKIGFELVAPVDEFLHLLARTPECDDFRMLHSDKSWMAYSTMLDKNGDPVRANAANPLEALKALREKMGYGA